MSATTSRSALAEMSAEECWDLAGQGGIGRVAFTGHRGLTVLPVNYRVHDGAIFFRTRLGGQMEEDLRTGMEGVDLVIAFEVDRIDEAARAGWSVLFRGPARLTPGPPPWIDDVRSWAGDDRDLHIQIIPHEVTGRRVQAP